MQGVSQQRKDGYRASGKSPIGIGGAIAVHAAVFGVILLMPKEMIDRFTPPPMWTENIPLPKPVVEPRKEEKRQPLQKPDESRPTAVDPIVIDLPHDDAFDGNGIPSTGSGIGPGSDMQTVPRDPPRQPVLVDALPDPRARRDFQPDYPPSMQRAQQEGKVTVRVRIDTDGRVVAVEKLFATSDAFWDVTERQALRKWRFRPAMRDGVPVEGVKVMTVHFQLEA